MTTNPDLVHPQSPAQFGELLRKHSKRTGRAYLYPGDNYKSLARYVEGNASSISLQSMSSTEPKEEPYAVLYDLSKEDEGRECHYSGSGGVEELRQLNLDGPAYLLFLRGVSSPDWLSMLATTFSVDPEFLQRQFASTNIDDDHGDLFVSPDLPSSGTNALHLPVVTLLSRKDKDKESGGRDLSDLREASELEMAKYREWMSAQTTVGSSLVRNYYQLSSRHAVMEQNISVSLSRLSAGWVNIVWMDHGQDIGKSARGPWLPEGNRSPFYECLPIIHRQEFLPYREVPAVRLTTSRSYQGWSAAQNANLLPLGYGAWLQHDLMRDDPC
ncbi:Hypothetical protein D9617_10g071850 [Elsinoe fawcettii]|nr:Hypothetical protein D9617_10g071850 [Elsinoe fawcettii]